MSQTETELLLKVEFEGLAPSGNCKRLIRIASGGLLEHYAQTGNRSKIQEAWLIPDICQFPAGIWNGLGRVGQEEAFCYSGVPLGMFAQDNQKVIEIPANKVFLVFLTNDFQAVKWCYCQADPNRPGFPVSHDTRFGERLWPTD